MGEVWKARDTTLRREVTIKMLPAAFAQDADRLARLEREAMLLASLNHPNIATIHGLEAIKARAFSCSNSSKAARWRIALGAARFLWRKA